MLVTKDGSVGLQSWSRIIGRGEARYFQPRDYNADRQVSGLKVKFYDSWRVLFGFSKWIYEEYKGPIWKLRTSEPIIFLSPICDMECVWITSTYLFRSMVSVWPWSWGPWTPRPLCSWSLQRVAQNWNRNGKVSVKQPYTGSNGRGQQTGIVYTRKQEQTIPFSKDLWSSRFAV